MFRARVWECYLLYSTVAAHEILQKAHLVEPHISLMLRSEFGALALFHRARRPPPERLTAHFIFDRWEVEKHMRLLEQYLLGLPLGTSMKGIDLTVITPMDAAPLDRVLRAIGHLACEHMEVEVSEAVKDAKAPAIYAAVPRVPQLKTLSIRGCQFFSQPILGWTLQTLKLDSLTALDIRAAELPPVDWKRFLSQITLPRLKEFSFEATVSFPMLQGFLDRHLTIRDLTLNRITSPSQVAGRPSRKPKLSGVEDVYVNTSHLSRLFSVENAPLLKKLTIALDSGFATVINTLAVLAFHPALRDLEFEFANSGTGLIEQLVDEFASRPMVLIRGVQSLEFTSSCATTELDQKLYVSALCFTMTSLLTLEFPRTPRQVYLRDFPM